MATRSTISIEYNDGKVESIYCHNDGYLSGVGKTLLEFYNTTDKVKELISLGALSCVYENVNPLDIAPGAYFNGEGSPRMILAKEHSFDNTQANVTIAYHRDRKADLSIESFNSIDELARSNNWLEGHDYLWKDNNWYVLDNYETSQWADLEEKIKEVSKINN